jgi:hypothetical protein
MPPRQKIPDDALKRLAQYWSRAALMRDFKLGLEGHRVEAQGLGLPLRPLKRLAQNEECECASREA